MRLFLAVVVAAAIATGWSERAVAGAGVPGLRVLSSDPAGVTLEYRLPDYQLEPFDNAEGRWTRVRVPGLGALGEEGKPEVPMAGVWVALPPTGPYSVRVLEEDSERVGDVDLPPIYRSEWVEDGTAYPRPVREYFRDEAVYASSAAYPAASAAFGDESWMRFQRVAALRLFPVRYRPAERALTISRRLVVRVDFGGGSSPSGLRALEAAGLEHGPADDRYFEGIYRGAVINYEQGRAWRARAARSGPGSFGATAPLAPGDLGTGNPEWKVRVDTTGVWRVTFAQLSAKGWPAGIAIDAVTAFVRDTTVGLQPAPWEIRELPIDPVDLNGNSVFDAGDFLVLPVQNWADRVTPTVAERRYGDAEVVWLSWKTGGTGLRVRSMPGWLGAAAPARPTTFSSTRRYERDFFYVQFPDNVFPHIDQFLWTSGFEDGTPIDTLRADLMDLETAGGGSVRVRAQYIGNLAVQHSLSASWVSGAGETVLWMDQSYFGKGAAVFEQTFAANLATAGVNRLKISGSSPSTLSGSGAGLNWFEVTYPRRYAARNNRLRFTNAGLPDTLEFAVDGFVSASQPAVYAYDFTNKQDPVRLTVAPAQVVNTGGAWRVLLQAVVPPGPPRDYFVATEVAGLPDAAITAEVGSNLYTTPAGGADIVMLVHDPFAAALQPLVDFRRSQGFTVLVAKAQDIYDEFNGGRKSHFALRRFLRYAVENWDTRFALFVGDASEDARGVLGTSAPDYLPTAIIQEPVPVPQGLEAVPSDNWYALNLTGPRGPTEDLLLDLAIGRLPAGSAAELTGMVQKIIDYETKDLNAPWRSRAVLMADDDFSTQTTFGGGGGSTFKYCQKTSERIFKSINLRTESVIRNEGGFRDYDVRPFYMTDLLASIPIFEDPPCLEARDLTTVQTVVSNQTAPNLYVLLSGGTAFWNFQGHGNPFVMTHEEIYISNASVQDIDLVFNDGKPWMFTGFACHLNSFAGIREGGPFGDAIAERMVLAPRKGAIASFASTAFELLPFGDGSNHLNVHFFRAFFVDPPFERLAGRVGARVLIGEAAALGVARMVANNLTLERRAAETYVLLGDPVSAMSYGAPRLFASATDQDSLVSGRAYFPSVATDTVQVDVDVVDESFLESITAIETGEGARGAVPDSELVFTPNFPDTTSGRRYLVSWRTAPRAATYDVTFTATDRTGLTGQFVLRFQLEAALTAQGQTLRDGDAAISGIEHVWRVRSPARLEAGDFAVFVNDELVPSTAAAAPGDTTGRSWNVSFTPELGDGPNTVRLEITDQGATVARSVSLNVTPGLALANAYAFPNPFRDFTTFNFNVTGNRAVSVLLRVFTVSGRLVHERLDRGLVPGYYQWAWDGRDPAGDTVSHGVYIYRLAVVADEGSETSLQGKLVRAPVQAARAETSPRVPNASSR